MVQVVAITWGTTAVVGWLRVLRKKERGIHQRFHPVRVRWQLSQLEHVGVCEWMARRGAHRNELQGGYSLGFRVRERVTERVRLRVAVRLRVRLRVELRVRLRVGLAVARAMTPLRVAVAVDEREAVAVGDRVADADGGVYAQLTTAATGSPP
jgi:hypothetical protein